MKMIDNARAWWRLWSVRLTALGAVLQALMTWLPDAALMLWNSMPAELKAVIPQRLVFSIPLVIFAAAITARLIRQPKLHNDPAPEPRAAA